MASRFRVIAPDGTEKSLDDIPAVVDALRRGVINPQSLLFDSNTGRWLPANLHDAVQAATVAFGRPPATATDARPTETSRETSRPYSPSSSDSNSDTDPILLRLRAYIGPNWDSHYERPFRRLLTASQQGTSPGWTWNWPAALLPGWFLYRRLYAPFFGFLLLYLIIDGTDKAAGGANGGSPIAILFLGQVMAMGFVGDRLLFRKAFSVVKRHESEDPAGLAALGAPHKWAIWAPVVIIAISILGAVLAYSSSRP